jgi:hypothetical protein
MKAALQNYQARMRRVLALTGILTVIWTWKR